MKRFYFCLLALVLFTGQVSAQDTKLVDYSGEKPVTGVYCIKGGTSSYTRDWNGTLFQLPSGIDYMKFRIVNDSAWVFSYTGRSSGGLKFYKHDVDGKPIHWAIENKNYTDNIRIPSEIKYNNKWIPVVGIEDYAFAQLQLQGNIDIQCKKLKYIGYNAFEVFAKANSYTTVTIRTEEDLTIRKRAFKNSLFSVQEFKAKGKKIESRQDCNIQVPRFCLKKVDIVSLGKNITIEPDAFIYCEGLEEVSIVSNKNNNEFGEIEIGTRAFACRNITEVVYENGDSIGTSGYCSQPLDRMWERTNYLDSIYIQGKVKNIGEVAFAGHVNMKRVVIDSPASNVDLTIDGEAFLGLFHGDCKSTTLSDTEKKKMGVFITAPIDSIGYRAFQHFYYTNPAGTGASTEPTPPNNISFTDCLNTVEITHTGSNELVFPLYFVFSDRFVQTQNNSYPGSFKLTGKIKEIADHAFRFNDYIFNNNIGNSRLRNIEIKSTIPMRIGTEAFYNQMTSNTSPDRIGRINIENAREISMKAFYNNNKAMEVTINNETTSENLRILNSAFQNNFQHSPYDGKLTIDGKLKFIGQNAFANGYGLKTAVVNKTGSTPLTIDNKAFYQSMGYNEKDPSQPLFTDGTFTFTGDLSSIGSNSFSEMRGLKTFNLSSDSRFSIGQSAFENDITLSKMKYTAGGVVTNETLPDSVTKVGNRAFANTGFIEMTIPQLTLTCKDGDISASDMVKVRVTDDSGAKDVPATISDLDVYNRNNLLGSQVFADCTKLDSVTIKNSATGQATFANCTQLSKVKFDTNVKYIESGVFANTPLLQWLEIPENVEVIGAAIKTGRIANNLTSYRIKFNAKQPPLAHYHAFATAGDKKSNFNNWTAYVVVPWGCVSSYLFCSTDRGFQNVTGDHIACEYKLNKTWGTLGMQAHTIKEYTGNFEEGTDYGYSSPKLTELNKTSENYSFTDVYDFRRVGTDNGGNDYRTTLKISDTGDYDLRIERINSIKGKISLLTDKKDGLTASVFGVNVDYNGGQGTHWYSLETGKARLGCIFQFYQERNSLENITLPLDNTKNAKSLIPNQDISTFATMCESLWNELKPILDPSIQSMTLQQFVTNFAFPKVEPGMNSSDYGLRPTSIQNFINVFYGAPTLKLLELLQTNPYYDYFVLNFLNNIFQYVKKQEYVGSWFVSLMNYYYRKDFEEMAYLDEYCDFTNCTANNKSPIANLYNKYNEYVGEVQNAINIYNAAFPNHINWEIDEKFYQSLNEPFYVYTADTYYKETGKVGIDLLTAGPIIPNSLNGQPWNNGYLVKGKPQTSYFLFHYIGEGKTLDRKLRDYSKEKYVELKNTTSVNEFKTGITHCPTEWWANSSASQSDGFYNYNVYPNLLVAACNASDIKSGHYLYGLSPETDVIDFVLNYGLYQKDATDGVSTKCRFYLLSDGRFKRFRNWTQLSEGKCFLALPTQTMWGYPDDPHVDNPSSGSNDAQSAFFIYNNDYHFIGDFNPITTDIDTIGYKDEEDGENIRIVNGYWYNLDGTRLATPPTKKGIYIHNGKKIVVN